MLHCKNLTFSNMFKMLAKGYRRDTDCTLLPDADGFVDHLQGGPRHSVAANAMAGWASNDQNASHQRSGTTIVNDGRHEPAAGQSTRDMGQVHGAHFLSTQGVHRHGNDTQNVLRLVNFHLARFV